MAAKPQPLSLTAILLAPALLAGGLLAGGILTAASPAGAQTVIGGQGSGNVQVNLQALDQLGGASYGASGSAAGGNYGSYPAITGRPPLPGEAPPPQPLLGETGNPRASGLRLHARHSAAAGASLASTTGPAVKRPAKTTAPKPAVPAKPVEPAAQSPVVEAPTAVATAPAAEQPTPPAAAPAPKPMAVVPSVPAPVAPAAPAAAPEPPAPPAQQQVATAPVAPPPAAPANPASQQSAMVAPKPPPAPSVQGGVISIPFAAEQAELPKDNVAALDGLAKQLAGTEDRLQIRAYAAGTGTDGGSGARRLSLSRALAVRAYLIDKGIRSTRIDVRALGTPTDGSLADRVEVAPVGR